MKYKAFEEKHCMTANELWEFFSPTNKLFEDHYELIYRGQGSSNWELIPSVLRYTDRNQLMRFFKNKATADMQIFNELIVLKTFVNYCDNLGIKVPNDSIKFREKTLDIHSIDKYMKNPSLWPNEELFELMAMAQHHGVPTRLLDWTEMPYIAVYFAVSSALKRCIELLEDKKKKENIEDEKLAIWVLNIKRKPLYPFLKIIRVPRSTSSHLSSQRGLFTVHPHNGNRGGDFTVNNLENEFSTLPNTPLLKVTLPIKEAINLYDLCKKINIDATTVYPNTQGIEVAIKDEMNLWYLNDNLLKE